MKWLTRVKNANAPDTDATKATKPAPEPQSGGFVGFVAYAQGENEKFTPSERVEIGRALEAELGQRRGQRTDIQLPENFPEVSKGETRDIAAQAAGFGNGTWPHGTAWNAGEVDTFDQRLALFTDRGSTLAGAQGLAERLLARDRDGDDRRLCAECVHYRRGRCTNWAAAGFVKARDAEALGDYASALKRCPGFTPAIQAGGRHE